MQDLVQFTGKYSVSKTLRFALRPKDKTGDFIKTKNVLKQDEDRADQYRKAKRIIDLYHKDFIERALQGVQFSINDLNELERNRRTENREALGESQKKLRKQIIDQVKNTQGYKNLFKKELITQDLPAWLEKNPKAKAEDLPDIAPENYPGIIAEFKKWTTYFKGFHENRENIYSDEPQATAIAFRIVHENLPRFLDNRARWRQLEDEFESIFQSFKRQISALEEATDTKLKRVFEIGFFNRCLNQSGIDRFNLILGGRSDKDGRKLQGLNEIINLYRQQLSSDADKKKLGKCKMALLYKQILSDRESHSFLPEQFEKDTDLVRAINGYFAKIDEAISDEEDAKNVCSSLKACLQRLGSDEIDLEKVYIENKSLRNLSKACYDGDWGLIERALEEHAEQRFPEKKAGKPTKTELKKREAWVKKTSRFAISELQNIVSQHVDADSSKSVLKYFKDPQKNPFSDIKNAREEVKDILQEEYSGEEDTLHQNKENVAKIKHCLDSVRALMDFIKPLYVDLGRDDESATAPEKDANFYHDFELCYERLSLIVPLYNKVRNYLTRKPYKTEKYKLNFENSTLLAGWDVNKEKDNTAVILIKDARYYLAIMDQKHKKLFDEEYIPKNKNGSLYQKIDYKLLPDPKKMLPKVFFAENNINHYNPSQEILDIRNHGSHTKDGAPQVYYENNKGKKLAKDEVNKLTEDEKDKFKKKYQKHQFQETHCHTMVDFFKKSIEKHPDWLHFNFNFSPTKSYKDITEFYQEVESQGYKITFKEIDAAYIDQCVEEGRLYLFEIYCKDFSEKSKGRPNLHTLYWRSLFEHENLKDVVIKLDGKAEMFFRKASITYPDDIWKKGHHAEKLKGKFPYPIIKDQRYARDTYLFHVPVTINFKQPGAAKTFNNEVNKFLQGNRDVRILSIDRGERHLAYYTLLDQKGAILEQGSLNKVDTEGANGSKTVDYQQKLQKREDERDKARKSWATIESIKELKEGYLSQIVHKIAVMMVEHNAVVVFEDLNFGFKRGRFKFEKQVYQKFEKMLIDKLNYLVFKDRGARQPGGALCGYQLSAPFKSFKDMGKQTGFIYYVPAHYTSKVCPVTGFVNRLYPKYQNVEQAVKFFSTFDAIHYNSQEDYFEFIFSYSRFAEEKIIKNIEGMQDQWTVCTYGSRLQNSKSEAGKWTSEEIDLTDKMKTLLEGKGLKYQNGIDLGCLVAKQKDTQGSKDFFEALFGLLRLTLQLRNSHVGTDNQTDNTSDYILSCVKDGQGQFFDSRRAPQDMPQNADANGAFHIGLKGLWLLRQIHEWQGDWQGKKSPNFTISNAAWYRFIQKREYRNSKV